MEKEEAIREIKRFMSILPNDMQEAIMALVPELAESEDERIRKELKEAFEAYDIESTWNGIPIRSIFAWLEKQKEQKPAWSEEDEKMLRTIISDGSRGVELDSKQISFLRSLRPSWKPSEEQPSLPDNLDEAARDIVIKMHPCLKDCTILGDRLTRGQLMALVKAGAEWMANR